MQNFDEEFVDDLEEIEIDESEKENTEDDDYDEKEILGMMYPNGTDDGDEEDFSISSFDPED